MTRPFLPFACLLLLGLAAPAAAQDAAGDALGAEGATNERVMMMSLRPGEACPVSSDPETIIVCDEIEDPYRIPRGLRQGVSPQNESWAARTEAMERVGLTGPLSCSNVGGGAELGCTAQFIADAEAERESAPGVRYSEQIAAARAERLSTIDADAAITQSRVEQIEAEYMARLEAERDAPLPGEETALPAVVNPARP